MSNETNKTATSIGIIIDGNRRWAKEHNLPSLEGHRKGYEKILETMEWARAASVKEVIIYAFSTENWNRSEEEVGYLMKLFEYAFDTGMQDLITQDVRIRFIGERARLPENILKKMDEVAEQTKEGKNGTVAFALSYGGRAEILSAVNALLVKGREVVTEEEFREVMWSSGLADPDLIIRTGGEKRLSNFLTWQSVYSELFFTDTKWPAFTKEEFNSILADFALRERRLGK
ncbi:di-trans,poly-cis-decaprenylcistransferase [Patescibacteria group bacterium]|nr:di-trans,poly-cis-decaprenylcistransferase [Patescibacteria group bacterium]